MAYLDLGPPRKEYSPRALFELFNLIEQAINYLDVNNFPHGVPGSIIQPGTLPSSAIPDNGIPLLKLAWKEIPIPLLLGIEPYYTSSTTPVNLGGYFRWDPTKFPGGDWYFEASLVSTDSAATATCVLKGSQDYSSITTTSTALTYVRSTQAVPMPSQIENLWVTLKTSDATKAVGIASARLIFVPK
ncbi:hypothetical protein BSNK01_11830 [Bacillaceae bacterium]